MAPQTSSFNTESSSSSSSSIISSTPSLLGSLLMCRAPRAFARSRFCTARSMQRALRRSRRKAFLGGSSVGAVEDTVPAPDELP